MLLAPSARVTVAVSADDTGSEGIGLGAKATNCQSTHIYKTNVYQPHFLHVKPCCVQLNYHHYI